MVFKLSRFTVEIYYEKKSRGMLLTYKEEVIADFATNKWIHEAGKTEDYRFKSSRMPHATDFKLTFTNIPDAHKKAPPEGWA